MRLFYSELKKITSSRVIVICFFVLFLLNFGLTLHISQPLPYEKTVIEVYYQFQQNPETIKEYYDEFESNFR